MTSARYLGVALLLAWVGCDSPMNNNNATLDLSFLFHDLAQGPAQDDLAMKTTSSTITLTGDPTSGYTGSTLTTFVCATDPSFGATVSSQLPAGGFPAASPATTGAPLTLTIFPAGMWITGGGATGSVYFQAPGGVNTFNTTSNTGTVNNVALNGVSGAMGTLTANGGWKCP